MSIINSLNTAVSGLNAQSHAFNDLSNNIANSQTVGYKNTTTSFVDYVNNNNLQNSNFPISDSVTAITKQHTDNQGMIVPSSNPLSLAISNNGFFSVVKPSGTINSNSSTTFNSQEYYTRNGDFSKNSQGYIVNTSGYYLQGYMTDHSGKIDASSSPKPIQIPDTVPFQPVDGGPQTGSFSGISMKNDGSIMAVFDNGQSQLLAKIPLATFSDPNNLDIHNGQAYTATSASGAPEINAVNTNGSGTLSTQSVENSNTDLTGDLTKLIVAQQAYGANTKIVSTANQLLQTTLAMIQ